jgi:arylsulfatase
MFQEAGYITGAIGKWGLGGPGTTGEPNKQGFDFWYGYLCQRVAHNYYPTHLWKNGKKHVLDGNSYFFPHQKLPKDKDPMDQASYQPYSGKQYSMDLMFEETFRFIKKNHNHPFFLYLPFPVPHVSLQVPEDSLKEYVGAFAETPYKGDKGYVPHPRPRAAYAAMITRMDRGIGKTMDLLKELGILNNTLVIFTSDNGPTYAGGVDYAYFNSAGPLRDLKGSVYEGGIRVPMIASWPGKIKPGMVSDHVSAFWDFLPTFAEITGTRLREKTDGISILPVLTGDPDQQKEHEYLYWEHRQKKQAVRMGKWKGVRLTPQSEIELYDLETDLGEKSNVAKDFPQVTSRIKEIMTSARIPSKLHPLLK